MDIFGVLQRDTQGTRLAQSASQVMEALEQTSLDPIHVVAAAAEDRYIPHGARLLLTRRGVSFTGTVEAARYIVIDPDKHGHAGGDDKEPEFFTEAGVTVFAQLYDKYERYLETGVSSTGGEWSWYGELLLLALESDSAAVTRLLA